MPCETVWLDIIVKKESGKAWLLTDSVTDGWVPKSMVLDSTDDLGEGVACEVEIPLWMAEDKGFT